MHWPEGISGPNTSVSRFLATFHFFSFLTVYIMYTITPFPAQKKCFLSTNYKGYLIVYNNSAKIFHKSKWRQEVNLTLTKFLKV